MNRLSGIELCKKIRIENQICIICWRRRRGAKSGGTGSVIIGDWIKVSLAADFSKRGASPFP